MAFMFLCYKKYSNLIVLWLLSEKLIHQPEDKGSSSPQKENRAEDMHSDEDLIKVRQRQKSYSTLLFYYLFKMSLSTLKFLNEPTSSPNSSSVILEIQPPADISGTT